MFPIPHLCVSLKIKTTFEFFYFFFNGKSAKVKVIENMIKIVIFPLVFYRDVVSHNDCSGLPRPYRSRLEKVGWTNFALQIFKEITSYMSFGEG